MGRSRISSDLIKQTEMSSSSQTDNPQKVDWYNGLCGCFSNPMSCIITYFVPCVTFGYNAEKAGTCGFVPALLLFFVPIADCYIGAKTREDTREKYGIEGSFCNDCLCFICCTPCVLVQN